MRWTALFLLFVSASAHAAGEARELPKLEAAPPADDPKFPAHRHAFLVGGLFVTTGLLFGHAAMDSANTAASDKHARSAQLGLRSANESAAIANASFAIAGVAIAYGLVMELLPDEVARKATLTFEF